MSYKVTFHTEAYKSHRASKKNWELGTQNDHIKALNGLSFVEETKEELSWRLLMAGGNTPYELTLESAVRYEAWRNNPRNTIKFQDKLCDMERTIYPSVPCFTQGYVNVDAVIQKVEKAGTAKVEFRQFYDLRQYDPHMNGCYIQIEKF